LYIKDEPRPDVVVYACNSNNWEAEVRDCKSEASLGFMRPSQKQKKILKEPKVKGNFYTYRI
jgi:hypothetical protein